MQAFLTMINVLQEDADDEEDAMEDDEKEGIEVDLVIEEEEKDHDIE